MLSRSDVPPLHLAGLALTIAQLAMTTPTLGAQSASDSVAHRRIQPLPALGSAPETGLQFGATVLAVWEPAAITHTRPSSIIASALRTTKQQTRLRIEADRWTRGNARRIAGTLQWQEFPLPYYGIGDAAPESAEEIFTPRGTEATVTVQQRIAPAWYVTGGVRHLEQTIRTDSTGALRTAGLIGTTGSTITEWSAGVQNDTRNNLFAATDGHWLQLSYARSIDGVWSDHGYGTLKVDARAYRRVLKEHVLASQFQLTSVGGRVPFDQMALVGNSDILRGYARGRYRDRAVAAAQVEMRSPVRHRLGAVLFGGAGAAAPSIGSLTSHRLLATYGGGARFEIDRRQRTGIRVDYGRGSDGASGLYIGFNSAF